MFTVIDMLIAVMFTLVLTTFVSLFTAGANVHKRERIDYAMGYKEGYIDGYTNGYADGVKGEQ